MHSLLFNASSPSLNENETAAVVFGEGEISGGPIGEPLSSRSQGGRRMNLKLNSMYCRFMVASNIFWKIAKDKFRA
jgi:hypothetical protein